MNARKTNNPAPEWMVPNVAAHHVPTGKRCSIRIVGQGLALCDFGSAANPFTWVFFSELRPLPDTSYTPANLIAAAPNLLDALRKALNALDDGTDDYTRSVARIAARAALQKASGDAQ